MAPKQATYGDVTMEMGDGHVATLEMHRPPNNFFDVELVRSLADALEEFESDLDVRAVVLCSEGRHFCAGANFGSGERPNPAEDVSDPTGPNPLYAEAIRCFRTSVPIVAAVQGAAIGGGLGMALLGDFRVAAPEARFASNFARLGFHQGFGLSVTLPYVVGNQKALELLYTGRRITGEEAFAIGLADRLVPLDSLRDEALALAAQIAGSAPMALRAVRKTMRTDLADAVAKATAHESIEQARLQKTKDFTEGIRASAERRDPQFTGE
jgi:enoyl-CoA hydratase/carnithine racemase